MRDVAARCHRGGIAGGTLHLTACAYSCGGCEQGIRPDTVKRFFSPHVDVLSMGCLTQGYPALDLSLKINRHGEGATKTAVGAGAGAGTSGLRSRL